MGSRRGARACAPKGGSRVLATERPSAPTTSEQYSAVAISVHTVTTSSSPSRMYLRQLVLSFFRVFRGGNKGIEGWMPLDPCVP